MKVICKDRRQFSRNSAQAARGMSSISPDLDKLLAPKSHDQLETLEKQVRQKLRSNEPIDVDYWENLLKSISVYKAKARLRQVSQSVVGARLETLRKQQGEEATAVQWQVRAKISAAASDDGIRTESNEASGHGDTALDPEPLLRLNPEDKSLASLEADEFTAKLVSRV